MTPAGGADANINSVMLEAINANCTTVDCGGTEGLGGQCARLDTFAFVRAGHMSEDFCSWLNVSVGLTWGIYAAFRLVEARRWRVRHSRLSTCTVLN